MIHPTAKVRPSANIHPTAIIGPNVTIGERVYVGPFTVIGMHAEHHQVEPRTHAPGRVVIEDDCTIHELVTIQGSYMKEHTTLIGRHCRIQAHAHIGHDAQLGEHTTVACGAKVGGHAFVGPWCNLGLNSVLHQMAIVGPGVMLGASAFAKGTLQEWTIYAGVPAAALGPNHIGLERKAERDREEQQRATVV